jgi:2-oxo-hept-3-ene-1,7-dioate hydratase
MMVLTEQEVLEQGRLHFEAIKTKKLLTPPSYLYPDMGYDDAYAIASAIVDEYKKAGYTESGKKVGLTSNVMRKHAGIDEPDYGIIFHELCYQNESDVRHDLFAQPRVEAELCFKLRKDLRGQNITIEQVLDATAYVVPALEIVDIRQRADIPRKIFDTVADNASFGAYVVGDRPIMPYEVDFGLVGFVFEYNNHQKEVTSGTAVLDHPAKAVAWLAERFTRLGNPLVAGEMVMSGSAVTIMDAHKGDNFRCKYGRFGEVSVNFL